MREDSKVMKFNKFFDDVSEQYIIAYESEKNDEIKINDSSDEINISIEDIDWFIEVFQYIKENTLEDKS